MGASPILEHAEDAKTPHRILVRSLLTSRNKLRQVSQTPEGLQAVAQPSGCGGAIAGHVARAARAKEAKTRLSSLCSFRTLYFTPESGPATEGFSCRGAVMNDEGNAARKIRKLRASRDLWKQRSAEKQQEIRHLRVTVRDLSSSRENWKTRVKELEQQLQAAHQAHAAVGPDSWIFFGGLMDNQAMPRTRRTPITLSSD